MLTAGKAEKLIKGVERASETSPWFWANNEANIGTLKKRHDNLEEHMLKSGSDDLVNMNNQELAVLEPKRLKTFMQIEGFVDELDAQLQTLHKRHRAK